MSARVRFSQERPGITYVPSTHSGNSHLLTDLLKKPMPPRFSEKHYEMDACTAASIGDEARLMELFKYNPSIISSKNSSGWTPLLYAAYLGHITVTTYLLEQRAKVDDCNSRGQTALMMASACGNTNVVRLLLDKNANVKMTDCEKRQAIHYAASCSQNVVVDTLLLAGADPNSADVHGMTSVHEAALTGHELTFLSLLEKGGNIELKNEKGENAYHLACDNNKILQIISDHKKESAELIGGNSRGPRNLAELLEEMDLHRYIEQFKNENIDLNVFFDLKKNDFEDMKIAYGPKKRMLDVIERYRTTGVIRTDAFDGGAAAPRCSAVSTSTYASQSSIGSTPDELNKYVSTLRSIRDLNINTKKYAMDALEALGSGQPEKIRTFITSIIDSSEQITAKVSTHEV